MEIDQELKGIVAPGKTSLLVWDVQNRLVQSIYNTDEFLANTTKVVSAARESGVQVIFSKITPLPEKFESPVRKYFFKTRPFPMKQIPNGLDLTIEPIESDTVIPKNTASMFIGTNYEMILRNSGITTIVLTGISTEYGVESTARDALNRGFFPVIITDAVSSMSQDGHDRSLINMKRLSIQLTTDEIISLWK